MGSKESREGKEMIGGQYKILKLTPMSEIGIG